MVFEIPLNRKTLIAALILLVGCVLVLYFGQRTPHPIDSAAVWEVVQKEAQAHDLDPAFVYAIARAESSLDAHADSGVARGMMQITKGTWGETTDIPYRKAYHWPTSIRVGTRHLAELRDRLESENAFSYARLAAAYRYGYYGLKRVGFAVEKLDTPRNHIYRQLFLEEIPEPSKALSRGP